MEKAGFLSGEYGKEIQNTYKLPCRLGAVVTISSFGAALNMTVSL